MHGWHGRIALLLLLCAPTFSDTFKACPKLSAKEVEDGFAILLVGVIDGDTVDVRNLDDCDRVKPYRVRLAEIHAPEKGQPYGKGSAEELRALVLGRKIGLLYKGREMRGVDFGHCPRPNMLSRGYGER